MIFNNLENEETKCNMDNSENKNQFAYYVNNMLLTRRVKIYKMKSAYRFMKFKI